MNPTEKTPAVPAVEQRLIAFSVSYEEENLLARGLGLEHLRELLIRLARPIVRKGVSLAYGGDWVEREGNFTYQLLNLISAEQEDESSVEQKDNTSGEQKDNNKGGQDTNPQIGILYNHTSWPYYLKITRRIEAQWINACRIVRITQQDAGLADPDIAADDEAPGKSDRAVFSAAVTLSAMRRKMMERLPIKVSDAPTQTIPAVSARIMLGGKVTSFSGFLPGLFEEALASLEKKCPIYILGGFGGAAEALTKPILNGGRPSEFMEDWLVAKNEKLARLQRVAGGRPMPTDIPTAKVALDRVFEFLSQAYEDPAGVLRTGLSDDDTRKLMQTRDIATAVRLVRQGLTNTGNLR